MGRSVGAGEGLSNIVRYIYLYKLTLTLYTPHEVYLIDRIKKNDFVEKYAD